MKIISRLIKVYGLLLFFVLASCNKSNQTSSAIDPFSNGGSERNMIVIMSDMHMGADLAYSECKANLDPLEKLLKQIKAAPNVKELVIAGDLVDEWFVPADVDTYQGKDQADFVKRLATTNKGVFDVINSIIQEGKILVTYTPGNHDIAITEASIELILPGINQARDNVLGLGTYSPADCPLIAIEHSHRYNFFCAPDPLSNQDIAPGTILPPGYFFTRIAALYVEQQKQPTPPPPVDSLPKITPNSSGDSSQNLLFKYWETWYTTMKMFSIGNKFDEDIIITNMNGFTGNFSVDELVPYQSSPGGYIDVYLYKGIQEKWIYRENHNHVAVPIKTEYAVDSVMSNSFTDYQASQQYFLNPASGVRIVVFGHTHVPRIESAISHDGKKCIYANSGTWIDNNTNAPTTMNFVVITLQSDEPSTQTLVKLYNFENEVVTLMGEESTRY
ncbi:MAG: metallophosphoesterase [Bacteroidales bacterium]|nr:metallophosphoesterase [Bacteroidales bacterium]